MNVYDVELVGEGGVRATVRVAARSKGVAMLEALNLADVDGAVQWVAGDPPDWTTFAGVAKRVTGPVEERTYSVVLTGETTVSTEVEVMGCSPEDAVARAMAQVRDGGKWQSQSPVAELRVDRVEVQTVHQVVPAMDSVSWPDGLERADAA